MPIHCPIAIRNISQQEFDARDSLVMRCAYAVHNALGSICDEQVYETDLALRLRAAGMANVHTQVPVIVSFGDFQKTYRLDLVADHALYEIKTVAALLGEHDAQVMHYAMLLGVTHGKLLNFGAPKVQGRLRCNAVFPPQRRNLSWDEREWRPISKACDALRTQAKEIISDWGGFLGCSLYEEALVHFCGGESKAVFRVPIRRDDIELGTHRVQTHSDRLLFVVTALTGNRNRYHSQLKRLLMLTGFKAAQWINLNHHRIEFITVQ
ncbi:MAG: GxxExxY protein [Verrucomicrobiota bacterium]